MTNNKLGISTKYLISLALAVFFTVGIRLVLLGDAALSDGEALNALHALGFFKGGVSNTGSEAGYVLGTSIWFTLFGAGNFGARLLPTLFGAALALTPWLFRKYLGIQTAIILCFALAIDASWVAASRQVGGITLAGLFTLLAIFALLQKRSALFGVMFALSIFGGPAFWQGILALLVAYGLFMLVFRPQTDPDSDQSVISANLFSGINWKVTGIWFCGVILAIGLVLALSPGGISSAVSGLINYLQGWKTPGEISIGLMGVGLILSQPLGFFFAFIGVIRSLSSRDPVDVFLAVWWVVALVLALVYPAREMTSLVWPALPMLAIAARQISILLKTDVEHGWVALSQALIVVILLVFSWLSFIAFFEPARAEVSTLVRVITTLLPIILIIGGIFAVRSWWSEETAGQGALWGVLTALTLWGFSAAWAGAGLGAHPEGQLWQSNPRIGEVDLLTRTISDLSTWKMRETGELELVVSDVESPGLRWALKDYRQVKFVTSTSPSATPAMVITGDIPEPNLAETYRGQDFVLNASPDWQAMTADEWLNWVAFKTAPLEKKMVILWARTDLFPDAAGFNP